MVRAQEITDLSLKSPLWEKNKGKLHLKNSPSKGQDTRCTCRRDQTSELRQRQGLMRMRSAVSRSLLAGMRNSADTQGSRLAASHETRHTLATNCTPW